MKRIFVYSIASALFFLSSCGGSTNGWPDEAKTQMLEGCKGAASEEVCNCYIDKVIAKYTPEDAVKEGAIKEMGQIMQECMAGEANAE